ncbi:MAG TPA: acetate--CoA ligase family protein [Syntrophales bacterium]|nr:acetate--CoA ligase family protein [Syntrophales bacterium]
MYFFFDPDGIAVVGATPNKQKGGYAIFKNLIAAYKGGVYPVNPRYSEIEGVPCYSSVSTVSGHVDLAIVFVPAHLVPQAIEDCAAKGVRGVMIESGGFAETGPEGSRLQQSVKDIAKRAGIRLWGPNCMGLVDVPRGLVFSFMDPRTVRQGALVPGNVSLVVQSGLLSAGFLVDIMSHHIMGMSKVCSIGNKIDVNECDLLPYLLADAGTEVVGLYLESFVDGRRFMEQCRNAEKPIVVLHGGKSKKGAEAAMSHTASLAGNYKIISGALAGAGVTEAYDFHQMMDICRSLASRPRPENSAGRIAVLTFSGGSGIIASDFIEKCGLSIAELSQETKEILGRLFPDWMPVKSPVDLWPAIEKHAGTNVDVYSEALATVLADPEVDAAFVHTFAGSFSIGLDMKKISEESRKARKPVFLWLLGRHEEVFQFQAEAVALGIPVFREISRAVECLTAAFNRKRHPQITSEHPKRETAVSLPRELSEILKKETGPLDEHLSKSILRNYGIPAVDERIIPDAGECEKIAAEIGFPLVMKGLRRETVHKTELGLVQLNIQSPKEALETFTSLKKKMDGNGRVIAYRQVKGRIEIIVGLVRDIQFGPCVMLGLGGIMAEVLSDAVFVPAPLTERDALRLISRLKGQTIFDGFRGEPPVDRKELACILVALGDIGLHHPRIYEIDINPLIVGEGGLVAVDATIVLR